ncbi:hypothetical protein KEM56_001176 [Ascosphaera pollenicola]|nr:hypothetical protein KEM56_001176 [Ascosphaera pollenicola]
MPSPLVAKEQARRWALYAQLITSPILSHMLPPQAHFFQKNSKLTSLQNINNRDPKPGYYQNGQKINLDELSEAEIRFMMMTGEVTNSMLEDIKTTPKGRQFMKWIERGRQAASRSPS